MVNVLMALAAFGALGIAAVTFYRQRSGRAALRDMQRRLYLAQARLNEMESMMQQELQTLRALVRRQSGGPLFESTMKIADAIAIDPRVRDVLAQFHLGGCSSCAINEEHTIEQAAISYGVDLKRLMATLTVLNDGQESPPNTPQPGGLLQLTEL
jgi:hybrid cluster-associated redox disulfide protein